MIMTICYGVTSSHVWRHVDDVTPWEITVIQRRHQDESDIWWSEAASQRWCCSPTCQKIFPLENIFRHRPKTAKLMPHSFILSGLDVAESRLGGFIKKFKNFLWPWKMEPAPAPAMMLAWCLDDWNHHIQQSLLDQAEAGDTSDKDEDRSR